MTAVSCHFKRKFITRLKMSALEKADIRPPAPQTIMPMKNRKPFVMNPSIQAQ